MYNIHITHLLSGSQDTLTTPSKFLALWLKAALRGKASSIRVWDVRNKRFI